VHVRQIMRKFGASNRTQAVVSALRWNGSPTFLELILRHIDKGLAKPSLQRESSVKRDADVSQVLS